MFSGRRINIQCSASHSTILVPSRRPLPSVIRTPAYTFPQTTEIFRLCATFSAQEAVSFGKPQFWIFGGPCTKTAGYPNTTYGSSRIFQILCQSVK